MLKNLLKCPSDRNKLENKSIAETIALFDEEQQQEILDFLGDQYSEQILYEWLFWSRPKQIMPDGTDWTNWLLLAGRGFGKTKAGAEAVKQVVESRDAKRIALVAETPADARDVMIEGESGLLNIFPKSKTPDYQPSKRKVIFSNGAVAHIYSGHNPDQLRGPQHDFAWCDELASWKYQETFDNLLMGLRLGSNPRCVITTTPRPIPIIKQLVEEQETIVTRGTTYENINNLPPAYINRIINKYEGTRLGRQELEAQILESNPNALWNRELLEEVRIRKKDKPQFDKIAVAIDPAITSNKKDTSKRKKSNEVGIVIVATDENGQGYVLEDLSRVAKPHKWGNIAVEAYHGFKADLIIAESNQGGEMVENVINTIDDIVPVKLIHASRGKYTRAEPVSSLYEQKRVYHVGSFAKLEDQMCNFTGTGESPDRLDALVHGLTHLLVGKRRKIKKVKPAGLNANSRWRR